MFLDVFLFDSRFQKFRAINSRKTEAFCRSGPYLFQIEMTRAARWAIELDEADALQHGWQKENRIKRSFRIAEDEI